MQVTPRPLSMTVHGLDNNDRDLRAVRRILDGDVNAFEELVERHQTMVFAIASKRIPERDVERVAMDAFLSAFRSLGSFRFEQPVEHWLSRIAYRRCVDYWRKAGRTPETPISELSAEHTGWIDAVCGPDSKQAFEEQTQRREAREVLDLALSRLKADDRAVVDLLYFEGCDVREAAATLQWGVSKVKVRAMRARRKLRVVLEQLQGVA